MRVKVICAQISKYLNVPIKRKAAETAATVRRRAALKKNADSICEQSNREALGTQEKIISDTDS